MGIHAAPGERYTIRRKVFVLFGASLQVFDRDGKLVAFCRQKAFKLREDLRLYSDENQSDEVLSIIARNIIDWSATYDVRLPDGTALGSLRRRGFKSIIRDSWLVFNAQGNQIAEVREDSTGMAIVRRFLPLGSILFPSKYDLVAMSGRTLASFRQHMNIFVYRMGITVHVDDPVLDDLLILAAGCLLTTIEGRQGNDSDSILDVVTG